MVGKIWAACSSIQHPVRFRTPAVSNRTKNAVENAFFSI